MQYAHMSEYARLKPSHAEFHKFASEIVRDVNNKKSVDQVEVLGAKSKFARISKLTIQSILDLKTAIGKLDLNGAKPKIAAPVQVETPKQAPIVKEKVAMDGALPSADDNRFDDV